MFVENRNVMQIGTHLFTFSVLLPTIDVLCNLRWLQMLIANRLGSNPNSDLQFYIILEKFLIMVLKCDTETTCNI